MREEMTPDLMADLDADQVLEYVDFHFALTRREVVGALGAGLLISVLPADAFAQRAGRRGGAQGRNGRTVAARLHIGNDGFITVLTGKVEGGQGARAELTQAAAEELRITPDRVKLLMGDTSVVPDDGITAGSRSTPSTVPAVRQGCAAARLLLVRLAADQWKVDADNLEVKNGVIRDAEGNRQVTYAQIAAGDEASRSFGRPPPPDTELTPVEQWKVLGVPLDRPNARDIVTGAHAYPSDIVRPGMLYGKILRPPAYGARLTSINTDAAQAMKDVIVVRDDSFVGVAAPTTYQAEQALKALAKSAVWDSPSQPSVRELYDHLRRHARGGVPANEFKDEVAKASKSLRQTYHVAYVQHVPLEPRAAVAEWSDGKLTVWTSTQNPFGVRGELVRAFRLSDDRTRVIVPDFGGGFGGKHTGETAVEAARLAQGAGRPVCLRWTRAEEFTWAYFRPAAVIDAEAGLDRAGRITSWHFVNINAGGASIETPYRAGRARSHSVASESPLRTGSYRALAATANNFARESFMDELAAAAGCDPLEFRLAHLENDRLRAVLETAAARFGWAARVKKKDPTLGVGLACGTEKGSVVAACVEVAIDPSKKTISVRRVCEAFECGAILNPENLMSQVQGCIIMGLGPALREAMDFENGRILNATFWKYLVPRFADLPELDIHLVNRPDLPSVGAGETPIIAVAPAIANAVFHATGVRIRELPIRLPVASA